MQKLLIVIDMQKDFINGVLGTREAVDVVPKVISKIKGFNGEVIYTRDTHDERYLESQEGIKLPVVHCIKETEGWRLMDAIDELAIKANSKIFDKSAFGSMEMVKYVSKLYEEKKVDEVELVGVCTDICVISNSMLLKSTMPELKIVVDSECCAGVTPESHRNALNAMNMCQIEII